MKKHRGLWLGLGLAALLGLSASEAQAAQMTLTVYLDGNSVYDKTGTATSVTADVATLNSNLAGSGYTFTSLSGASNSPGSTTNVGGFITDSGNVSFSPGNGGTLTIVVQESGFTAPTSGMGNFLSSNATATFTGATTASTQTYLSQFQDNAAANVLAPLITQTATTSNAQSATTTAPLPSSYVIPYTLTATTTIALGAATTGSPANDVFTGTTSVLSVPEPASLIMMVTGMPLPLVVMGLLRRRRAAA